MLEQLTLWEDLEKPAHSPDHRNCPPCDEALRREASPLDAALTFAEAAAQWIGRFALADEDSNARYLAPRTLLDLERYTRAAGKFLGKLKLEGIHLGHLREYQRAQT